MHRSSIQFTVADGLSEITVTDRTEVPSLEPDGPELTPEMVEQARADGLAEGAAQRQALEARIVELEQQLLVASDVLPASLSAWVDSLRPHFEREITSTAIAVAENVLRRELDQRSDIDNAVREALSLIDNATAITLYLSAADYDAIATSDAVNASRVTISRDSSLQPGELRVHSDVGFIDGTITRRLADMRDAIGIALTSRVHESATS